MYRHDDCMCKEHEDYMIKSKDDHMDKSHEDYMIKSKDGCMCKTHYDHMGKSKEYARAYIIPQKYENLFSCREGFLMGTIFKDLYRPYHECKKNKCER
ncbi:MAG: spore coat associated protein CotJA [Clostridium sp.]|nr:spore coat associated protein CotJA [Clostridium sp.]MCE5221949.1 spore coat associated protein CotJA [Clostridium sp.]